MSESRNSTYFPLLINLQKFPCLVIGGGKVALRKVLSLQEFNVKATILSPKICEQLLELGKKNKIKIISKAYSKEYLKDYKIVFCATNNQEINKRVHRDCEKSGILLNVVDIPALCDYILPATLKRGNLTISISSQGKAPFYIKEVKDKLESHFTSNYKEIIELAGIFRENILNNKKFKSKVNKEKAFQKFLETDWLKILDKEGKKFATNYMQLILHEITNSIK
ncbi:bifunctional precorrin-2 dehydrogenase/sirohydrochlorin ferrochelatase [Bacteroidota bacterium]